MYDIRRWQCLLGTGVVVALFAAPAALGQPADGGGQVSDAAAGDLWHAEHLTGDWGGWRSRLEDNGISVALSAHIQFMVNMNGGLETTNGSDFAASYNLELGFDLEKMGLVPGADFVFEAKGTSGNEISDFDREKIGALFKTNADANEESVIFVDKWWWHQRLFEDKLELRLGRIESEKDLFDVNGIAGHEDKRFMNKALVANPTIPHKLGLGACVTGHLADWLYLRAAIIDPESRERRCGFKTAFHGRDRMQAFFEVGATPELASTKGPLAGRYLVGTWYNPGPQPVFVDARVPRSLNDDVGFYLGFEQMVWKEQADEGDKQGLSVFGRFGHADEDTNLIEHFWSTGAQYAGLIPTRDDDVLGLGMAQAIMSDQYRREIDNQADRETVYELYYAFHATPWCVVTPDIQYVHQAGGDSDSPHAAVAGLRFRICF